MSLFKTTALACPSCARPLSFETVYSVNADRRPDLRAAIIDGSFQRMSCPHCGAGFRLDTDFTLLDIKRGQWIVAAPVAAIADWEAREAQAREMFARAYGEEAPPIARELGQGLEPRIVFGWPALREKLVAADLGLDDVALEAVKATVLRSSATIPGRAVAELRLIAADKKDLLLAWQRSYDGAAGEVLSAPRALHDQIAADTGEGWAPFRAGFEGALFVDLKRDLVPGREAA
ncbi:MAG: CpXC domain-containing protein [Caldimonas sp.]